MSAVPAIRTPWKARPVQRPAFRVVAGRRTRPSLAAAVTLFIFVGGAAFFTSSLVGHVMVEKARREGIWARARAADARKEVSVLRARIDAATSLGAVEVWARSHGFEAPVGLAPAAGGVRGVR